MSSQRSYAIIGIRIPVENIFRATEIRGCHHPLQPFRFCPDCAKPMWTNGPDKPTVSYINFESNRVIGLPHYITWVKTHFKEGRGVNNYVFIGLIAKTEFPPLVGKHVESCDLSFFETTKNSLKTLLDPDGMWDEAEFKLWGMSDYV